MQFENFSDFMTMGGHGVFVWSVYAIAAVVLVLLAVNPVLKKRKFMQEQQMRLRREQMQNQQS